MTESRVNALDVFDRAYKEITKTISYDRSWSDGHGYHVPFLKATDFYFVKVGDVLRSVTPGGRRLIMIRTRYGMVMVSERYMPDDKRGQHIVVEACDAVHAVFNDYFEEGGLIEPVNGVNLTVVLGTDDVIKENIGFVIENIVEYNLV